MNNPIRKYKGRYRIPSSRLPEWDYGIPGYYFVTICTQNRVFWFGEVKENQMILSPAGIIAMECLGKIPHIYPNISIDTSVVMPNHIHAIIVIGYVETSCGKVETPYYGVSTKQRKLGSRTLGLIISRYKFSCTKSIRSMGSDNFAWQARFYDHIIRSEKSLDNIRAYLSGNPINWSEDDYFSCD